jgi:hypothetical protein
MLTNFSYKFLNAGSFIYYSSYSCFYDSYFRLASVFLKGGTNFFLTDVPFGKIDADINYPAGTTAFAAIGI